MINIQNIDVNEWFKWCLVRYLYLAGHLAAIIRKVDKNFTRKLDFKDITFSVKIRDILSIEKRILIILVFLVMEKRQNIQSMSSKL